MAGSVNKAILVGNLGRDPEARSLADGGLVVNLSVATSESWKKDGERKERTDWHRVVVWGKLAEIAEKILQKGSKVYLEGKIETRRWKDQSDQDRYTTEIILRGYDAKLVLLSDGRRHDAEPEHPSDPARQGPPGGGDLDDEIPFAPLRDLP